jgi:hypothetical protein
MQHDSEHIQIPQSEGCCIVFVVLINVSQSRMADCIDPTIQKPTSRSLAFRPVV